MNDPWGLNEPAAPHPDPPDPLPPQLAKLASLSGPHVVAQGENWENPGAQALPEVTALLARGWALPGDDGPFGYLPAVWPPELRCWLPDRLPRISGSFDGRTSMVFPADQLCHPGHRRTMDLDTEADVAARVGLPNPPHGRIWLLKSPWPAVGLKMVLRLMVDRAAEHDGFDAPAVVGAAREMLQWDETRLREWWTGDTADAALAWQRQGRVGEDVVDLVHAGIGPDAFARMPGLTHQQTAAWRWALAGRTAREAVDRVVFFRSVGLPETPPDDLYRLHNLSTHEVTEWLAAGFDVATIIELTGFTVEQAIVWRVHGYPPAQTQELLEADPMFTAAEADAFTEVGIVGRHRMEWIRRGFAAVDAAAYDELDIQPNEARVWRSMGLGPADAEPGQLLPPGDERGGCIMSGNMRLRDAEHSVEDPPATRGAIAAERREQQNHHRRRPPQSQPD